MSGKYLIGANGNRLAADIGGLNTGPPVILLHGAGQTRHAWRRAFDELTRCGYYALSIDARGHGESDWAEDGNYSVDAFVADLCAIASTLRDRPILIGASMGGVTSLIAQGADPTFASALVLVDIAPKLEAAGIAHILRFMSATASGFATLDDAVEAVRTYNPCRPQPTNPDGLRRNLRQGQDGRLYWHWDPRLMEGDHHRNADEISRRMVAAAARIRIPTLLVRGKQSDVVSTEGVDQLREKIPDLEWVDIDGAGHMVVGDKNDAFNAAITEFLQRHPSQLNAAPGTSKRNA